VQLPTETHQQEISPAPPDLREPIIAELSSPTEREQSTSSQREVQSASRQREVQSTSRQREVSSDDQPRRSGRQPKPTERYLSYMEKQDSNFVAYEAIAYLQAHPSGDFHPLEAYKASSDPDTIYWHEAMAATDKSQFLKAAEKEVADHTENDLWEVVHKQKVPQGALIAPGVWAMKRKR